MRERSVSSAETNETMFSPRRAINRCVSASSASSAAVPFVAGTDGAPNANVGGGGAAAAGAPKEKPANAGLGAADAGALAAGGAVKLKPLNAEGPGEPLPLARARLGNGFTL